LLAAIALRMRRAFIAAEKIETATTSKPPSLREVCCCKVAENRKKPAMKHVIPNAISVLIGELGGMEGFRLLRSIALFAPQSLAGRGPCWLASGCMRLEK